MSRKLLLVAGVLAVSSSTFAHIGVGGPAPAGKSSKVTFQVNHGCNESTEDTVAIAIDIPAGVTAVRPMISDFGKPVVTRDPASTTTPKLVTKITWTKDTDLNLGFDDAYYELTIKATMPNTPYVKLPFVIHQTCINSTTNQPREVVWAIGDAEEPAPNVVVVPAKLNATGWNKFTIPTGTTLTADDIKTYFGDAQIVWKGTSAYTPNPEVKTALGAAGVAELTTLAAGDSIMVRY